MAIAVSGITGNFASSFLAARTEGFVPRRGVNFSIGAGDEKALDCFGVRQRPLNHWGESFGFYGRRSSEWRGEPALRTSAW